MNVEGLVAQSCPTLCNPIYRSLSGSSGHGIFQARILECVAISFSRGSSWPRDQIRVSHIVGRCFTTWATREVWTLEWVPFPSPGDPPNPGTESRSPSLQAVSLLAKPKGKPSGHVHVVISDIFGHFLCYFVSLHTILVYFFQSCFPSGCIVFSSLLFFLKTL